MINLRAKQTTSGIYIQHNIPSISIMWTTISNTLLGTMLIQLVVICPESAARMMFFFPFSFLETILHYFSNGVFQNLTVYLPVLVCWIAQTPNAVKYWLFWQYMCKSKHLGMQSTSGIHFKQYWHLSSQNTISERTFHWHICVCLYSSRTNIL